MNCKLVIEGDRETVVIEAGNDFDEKIIERIGHHESKISTETTERNTNTGRMTVASIVIRRVID